MRYSETECRITRTFSTFGNYITLFANRQFTSGEVLFFLQPESVGKIKNDSIVINVPTGTNVTALKAFFTHNGTSFKVSGTEQKNRETVNDFTNPIVYTLTGDFKGLS